MRRIVLIVAIWALTAVGTLGQEMVRSMSGRDFWMAFLRQNVNDAQCYIMVASEEGCIAHIENPLQGWDTMVMVAAGGISQVLVPELQTEMGYGWSVVDEAWHIETTADAIVYAKNYLEYSYDMTGVLPTRALRCEYMTQTYNSELNGPEVFIVAPYDSTEVSVVLGEGISSATFGGPPFTQLYYPGDTIETMLMRGQTCRLYSAYGSEDGYTSGFSGTRIEGSKPTAVFQGHTTAWIPVSSEERMRYGAGDVLYEQSMPTAYWGKRFLVPSIGGRTASYQGDLLVGDMVMVTSLKEGCMLTVGDSVVGPLGEGETYRFVLSNHPATMPPDVEMDLYEAGALPIEATSPVAVYFYIGSMLFAGSPGDPALAMVPPLEQGVGYTIVQVKNTPHTQRHYLSIVMATEEVGEMKINESRVGSLFTPAGNGYSYASISVGEGVYRLDGGAGHFLAMSYGLGFTESYAFAAGMSLRDTACDVGASGQRQPSEPVLIRDTICEGDTMMWHGRALTEGCIAWDTLVSSKWCDSVVALQLSVLQSPWAAIDIDADCESRHYSIRSTAYGDTTGYEFTWQSTPTDDALDGQPWDSLMLSPTEATEYSLKIAGRCPTDTAFILQPVRWPVAQMRVQPERLSIEQPTFDAYDMSENADRREWLVDDSYAGSSSVIHYTAQELADSVWLTLVASNGACVDTLTTVIPIDNPEVWAPNIFTPDGTDNNRFAPVLNECKAEGLYIYNRQGLLVARIEGDNPSWDGTRNGTSCPQGTYAYLLYFRSDTEPQRLQKKVGTVTLIR